MTKALNPRSGPGTGTILCTGLAMLAFAGNSLLCRLALREANIDPATFTTVRLISGAAVLALVVRMRAGGAGGGNWPSALALFCYAACFSFAYLGLTAATGALLLFGAVQATMIGHGIWSGERLRKLQLAGLVLALVGLLILLLPGLAAPPLGDAALMLAAGLAWGVYSLRGKAAGDPTKVTAGNFLRAAVLALLLSLFLVDQSTWNKAGIWYAVASGAVASGLGYALWYSALPHLKSTHAATLQLSVPLLVAMGGVVFLAEPIDVRLVLAGASILGGIAMVMRKK